MAQKKDIIDVLVVGAGASGAAFVWSLAEAGIDVMCLEQGGRLLHGATTPGKASQPTSAAPVKPYEPALELVDVQYRVTEKHTSGRFWMYAW